MGNVQPARSNRLRGREKRKAKTKKKKKKKGRKEGLNQQMEVGRVDEREAEWLIR